MNRRQWLLHTGVLCGVALIPGRILATPETMRSAIRAALGDAPVEENSVTLTLPALAENGNSVALKVTVDSPMTADDYVRTIHLFAEKNPLPEIAVFELSPLCHAAEVQTRIRLADTQTVTAIATLSDGRRFAGTAHTVVTMAACLDFLI